MLDVCMYPLPTKYILYIIYVRRTPIINTNNKIDILALTDSH